MTEKRLTGIVEWFNAKKGFGFIKRDDGNGDLFAHHTSIQMEGFRELIAGQLVSFTIGANNRGPQACDITVISEPEFEKDEE